VSENAFAAVEAFRVVPVNESPVPSVISSTAPAPAVPLHSNLSVFMARVVALSHVKTIFQSETAVSNSAFVHVIHAIEVWSPVLSPDKVVIPNLLLIVAVVSSPVFVPSAVPVPPAFASSAACKSVWSASVPVIAHQAPPGSPCGHVGPVGQTN